MISPSEIKNPAILSVPAQVVPNLDFIERILLDELIKQGRAEIISEENGGV